MYEPPISALFVSVLLLWELFKILPSFYSLTYYYPEAYTYEKFPSHLNVAWEFVPVTSRTYKLLYLKLYYPSTSTTANRVP